MDTDHQRECWASNEGAVIRRLCMEYCVEEEVGGPRVSIGPFPVRGAWHGDRVVQKARVRMPAPQGRMGSLEAQDSMLSRGVVSVRRCKQTFPAIDNVCYRGSLWRFVRDLIC